MKNKIKNIGLGTILTACTLSNVPACDHKQVDNNIKEETVDNNKNYGNSFENIKVDDEVLEAMSSFDAIFRKTINSGHEVDSTESIPIIFLDETIEHISKNQKSYGLTPDRHSPERREEIRKFIEQEISAYPEGTFLEGSKIYVGHKVLTYKFGFYQIIGSVNKTNVLLGNNCLFEGCFHHEMGHLVEKTSIKRYLENNKPNTNNFEASQMKQIEINNPNQINTVSNYAKKSPREETAEIHRLLYTDNKELAYKMNRSEVIYEKVVAYTAAEVDKELLSKGVLFFTHDLTEEEYVSRFAIDQYNFLKRVDTEQYNAEYYNKLDGDNIQKLKELNIYNY